MVNSVEKLIEKAPEIEEKLGYVFKDKNLLALSFIHRSFVNENKDMTREHNERLEFLGDSVLGLLVADYLYSSLPLNTEGDLSYLRSRLVEGACCVLFINQLNVESFLLLGKGERMNDGRGRESILADLFEALIGAIYLDGGIGAASKFLFGHFQNEMDRILTMPLRNWKAELQDYSQKKFQQTPVYRVVSETGPDHSKVFHVSVHINEEEVGSGTGASKKEAQQEAASDALHKILAFQEFV
ncbi:MAG: ribonuclease III [Chlamydiales bacterium]|nr:ribonuclease III [Chlamydiales bacterium]